MKTQMFFSLFLFTSLAMASLPREEGSFYDSPSKDVKEVCSDATFFSKLDSQGNPSHCYKNCQKPEWSSEVSTRKGAQKIREGVVLHGEAHRKWWFFKMVNFEKEASCKSERRRH